MKGDFPIAEQYYDRCISLPLYPSMLDSDVETVIQTVQEYIKKFI